MVGYYRLNELGYRLAAGSHVIPREAFEPVEAATVVVDAARAMADGIVADARTAFEEERQRGYNQGLDEARREAAQQLVAETLLLDRKLAGVERELAEIVIDSIRHLVGSLDDNAKAEILVRNALRKMRRQKRAELRVSPDQRAHLKSAVDSLLADFPEFELIDVIEDHNLIAPQVVVETAIGRVEGDLLRDLDILTGLLRNAATQAANTEPPAVAPAAETSPAEAAP